MCFIEWITCVEFSVALMRNVYPSNKYFYLILNFFITRMMQHYKFWIDDYFLGTEAGPNGKVMNINSLRYQLAKWLRQASHGHEVFCTWSRCPGFEPLLDPTSLLSHAVWVRLEPKITINQLLFSHTLQWKSTTYHLRSF